MTNFAVGDLVYRQLARDAPFVTTTVWEVIAVDKRIRVQSTKDRSMVRSVGADTLRLVDEEETS